MRSRRNSHKERKCEANLRNAVELKQAQDRRKSSEQGRIVLEWVSIIVQVVYPIKNKNVSLVLLVLNPIFELYLL